VILRELTRRRTRFREQRNSSQIEIVCCMRRGFANRLGNRQMRRPNMGFGVTLPVFLDVVLRFAYDAAHHRDRFHRIFSDCRLARQHHRICAVIHRIRNV